MSLYGESLEELIDALGRLPGVGPKSAQRIAFHLLRVSDQEAARLANAIGAVRERVRFCDRCFNIAESERCQICSDSRRDSAKVAVVEEPKDVVAIERSGSFKGLYHVLGGCIDHLHGIGPEQLKIGELVRRVTNEDITEVMISTNPNLEGDATALYLTKILDVPGVSVTRLASGLPVGGDLDYADELTLGRAIEGRRSV